MTRSFTIRPQGEFSLREAATFGFGQREGVASYDAVMRVAFCVDGGFDQQVGVAVRQHGDEVRCEVDGPGDLDAIRAQLARMLSIDHDARGFALVGRRDPVIRRLQLAAPGLRPPLFHSPYEAAAWCVLSARRPGWQMARVRTALSEAAGRRFTVAGQRLAAFPTPRAVLKLAAFPGVDAQRLDRLHDVARAALDGRLEAARLAALGPDDALTDVQAIKGVGPVSAGLIVVRGVGFTDVIAREEPLALAMLAQLYGLPAPATPEQFDEIAEAWRPWRTWAAVLVRAVGPRLLSATTRRSA
jgi:DNA-3-methyladenine glycosylase II